MLPSCWVLGGCRGRLSLRAVVCSGAQRDMKSGSPHRQGAWAGGFGVAGGSPSALPVGAVGLEAVWDGESIWQLIAKVQMSTEVSRRGGGGGFSKARRSGLSSGIRNQLQDGLCPASWLGGWLCLGTDEPLFPPPLQSIPSICQHFDTLYVLSPCQVCPHLGTEQAEGSARGSVAHCGRLSSAMPTGFWCWDPRCP